MLALRPYFSISLLDVVAALALAARAFDAQDIELSLDVAKDEITSRHGGDFP
jgi:hypothetical protein